MDALREGEFSIVVDQLKRPSYSFAAAIREIMGWGSTPVSAVAHSSHMEDPGFLQPLYRSQECEIRNFHDSTAEQSAREMIKRRGLSGSNSADPEQGARVQRRIKIDMARYPKYRSEEHIEISPLYIDFRMQGRVAG